MQAKTIPYNQINYLLDLIAGCDKLLANIRITNKDENSLMIKQEKHLKNQYLKDLNEILKIPNIYIQTTALKHTTY